MRILYFFLIILLYNGKVFAQNWIPMLQDTILDNSQEIWIDGGAQFNGNSLTSNFITKFFYGGNISSEIKDQNLNRMKNVNLFYSDVQANFSYRNTKGKFLKNKNIGWTVNAGASSYLTSNFNKQAFQLAFYGNAPFIGKFADISGSRIQNFTFEKIGFGLIDKKSSSSCLVNFVNLTNYSDFHTYGGGVYQSSDVDTLQIFLNGKFSQYGGKNLSSGFGASLDIDKRFFVFKDNGEPIFFRLEINNLGLVKAQSTRMYEVDTLIEFTGVTFNQLTGGAPLIDSTNQFLQNIGLTTKEEKSWIMLPVSLQLSKMVNTLSKSSIQEFYGVRMLYLSDIQVFAGVDYKVPLNGKIVWHIGTNISYGGSANFMFGNYSHISWNKFYFGILSENLLSRSGESIKLKLQCAF